jgi:hypothetical protein
LERAGHYYAQAAAQAAEALAFDRAAKLYRLALESSPASTDCQRRLRIELGHALANAGRGAQAAEEYLQAAQNANEHTVLELKRLAAQQFLISGYFDRGQTIFRDVFASIGFKLPKERWKLLVGCLWGQLLVNRSGFRFRERQLSEFSPEELTRIDVGYSGLIGFGITDPIATTYVQQRGFAPSAPDGRTNTDC